MDQPCVWLYHRLMNVTYTTPSAKSDPRHTPTIRVDDQLATITLRRPSALNALRPADIRTMTDLLISAVDNPQVGTIVICGEGTNFCAGGDIKVVRDMIEDAAFDRLADFWTAEYQLDHLIATCPKPVVTIAQGLTLGGGVGLASHAKHRIVTESSVLGMPEVLIGLAPDVGGLWLYGQAPGRTGVYAALTGAHLTAGDALYMGLADIFVPDADVDRLTARLRTEPAATVLAEYAHRPPSWIEQHRQQLDDLFAADAIHDIYRSVAAAAGPPNSFPALAGEPAQRAMAGMQQGAPTATAVTLRALQNTAHMAALSDCLAQDLIVGNHCARHPDLSEGIRARVVDKDRRPLWNPRSINEVTAATVDTFFEPSGHGLPITPW